MLKNYKELKVRQKVVGTLSIDIINNGKIPEGIKILPNFTDKEIGCFYFFKYS